MDREVERNYIFQKLYLSIILYKGISKKLKNLTSSHTTKCVVKYPIEMQKHFLAEYLLCSEIINKMSSPFMTASYGLYGKT